MSNKRGLDVSLEPSSSSTSPSGKAVSSAKAKKVKFVIEPPINAVLPTAPKIDHLPDDDGTTDLQFDELNQVGKLKKGRVKVEGYDSDSSTENSDVRQKKNKKSGDNDDDEEDMFGTEDDGPSGSGVTTEVGKSKFDKIDVGMRLKKGAEAKEFLDLGDIEGQEFGKDDDDGDDDSDDRAGPRRGSSLNANAEGDEWNSTNGYSDEEEDFVPGDEFANDDDAPRARRKSKKGMGFVLSKFNMAEELTEGRMAADGSYVASVKDPEAVHDNWLEGVNSKKTIKQAREAKMKRDEELRKRAAIDDSLASHRSRKDCYIALLSLLPSGDGRSVSQILCQLGNEKRARQQNEKKKIVKKTVIDDLVPDSMNLDTNHEDQNSQKSKELNQPSQRSEEDIRFDKTITEITDLASTLMGTHGDLDIYDMTHGSITGILKSEALVPRDWIPPSNSSLISSTKSSDVSEITTNMARKSLIARPTTASQALQVNPSGSIFYRFKADPTNPGVTADGTVYGPFDRAMMEGWASQGFFGSNYDRIEVKLDHSSTGSAAWGVWSQIMKC